MRIPTLTLLAAATFTALMVASPPATAMTADEIREKNRVLFAKQISWRRKAAEVGLAYAEKCEAAFAAGDPMPEFDISVTEEVSIDADLADMSYEELQNQSSLASQAKRDSVKAWKTCFFKFRQQDSGS